MPDPAYALDPTGVATRQRRLVEELKHRRCGLVVLTCRESVRWATGAWVGTYFPVAALIDDQGAVTVSLPSRMADTPAAATKVVAYEEKRLSTMRDAGEMRIACVERLLDAAGAAPQRAGCEYSAAPKQLYAAMAGEWFDFEPVLARLRRRKEPDELALMALANRANEAMYARAREVIRPGLNEMDLYCELHNVATVALGEPPFYLGQDFRSGARGGAPRDRAAEAGELWILDLGVGLRGYYTDNARTIAVGEPSARQQDAWRRVADVLAMIPERVRQGVRCAAVFDEAKRMLDGDEPWVFNHHLGHGVGLAPHEGPRLNPNWDDTFQLGDYFTAEPGLYHDELRHGVRLEQNYVVTEKGAELVTDWPLGL